MRDIGLSLRMDWTRFIVSNTVSHEEGYLATLDRYNVWLNFENYDGT